MYAISFLLFTKWLIDDLVLFMMTGLTSTLNGPENWTLSKNEMNDLIDPIRTKEREASFLKALDDHQGIIFKICRLYCNHRSEEEDLFQEIVYQLWKAYPSFQNKSKISTWMYSIAINTAATPYRPGQVKVKFVGELPDRPADEAGRNQAQDAFLEFFRSLSKIDRAIVTLLMEDYSRTEIGAITGISEEAVTMRVSRLKGLGKR